MPYKSKEEKLRYSKEYYQKNRKKILAEQKKRRDRDPELTKQKKKEERKRNLEWYKKYSKKYYSENKEELLKKSSIRNKQWRIVNKRKIVEHYTDGKNCCNCCGEDIFEFLTIDHINNDGAKHREEIGTNILTDLIHRNFPEGFQILCMNCNMAKETNGFCPHKKLNHIKE